MDRLEGRTTLTHLSQAAEQELVARAQGGDRNAFGELVRAHTEGVLRVVFRMCGDQQVAEDASQEAFVQAWLRLPAYRPRTPLRNWLYRIAVNAAIDVLRKERRIHPAALDELNLSDGRPDPEASQASAERARSVQQAVLALPEASRAVLVLREYQDLSYHEIAETLDIPVGTVMSRLNYARKLLKEKLEMQLFSYAETEHV